MLRKYVCLLWTLAVVSGMGMQGRAAEHAGTLRIIPRWCDAAVIGGEVSLCHVGTKTLDGYQLTDGLANWSVAETDFDPEEWIQWVRQKSGLKKMVQSITADAGAEFTGLKEGVYLVEQTRPAPGYTLFEPFLLMVPQGNTWDIIAEPKVISLRESPRTGDHPAPIIGAMGLGLSVAVLMVLVDDHKK